MPRSAYRISPVLRTLYSLVLLMTTLLVTGRSLADNHSGARLGDNRWVPSLAITVGATIQEHKGAALTDGFQGIFVVTPIPDGRETLRRPSAADSQTMKAMNVGGVIELQTPTLPIPFVHPRFFVGGELTHVSSLQRNLALEGAPEMVLIPPEGFGPYPALALNGRGTATRSDYNNMQLGAWVGISFPVQIGDWRVSIKPSARYLNQKMYFSGIFSHGIRDNTNDITSTPRSDPTNTFLSVFNDSLDVHAVGPGLEIEIEVGAVRSASASVFISGGAYRVLSDRKIDVTTRSLPSSTGLPVFFFDTRFTADIDPWIYRGNVGMRIKWNGAPEGWLFGLLGR